MNQSLKKYAVVASCNLNQWAMSFEHNKRNIIKSIEQAKAAGATYRLGPELEVTGYGCEDHFSEMDTIRHGWQVLSDILRIKHLTSDIVVDIGMIVFFKNTFYNCRVVCLNQKIILIRPKLYLADDGAYREGRWFTPWFKTGKEKLETYYFDEIIAAVIGQTSCPFGDGLIETNDTVLACETCEELWTPKAPHIGYCLDGAEIVGNGSGSHHELGKLLKRLDLIRHTTTTSGGIYLYSNVIGGDGGRVYYDGSSLISMNS